MTKTNRLGGLRHFLNVRKIPYVIIVLPQRQQVAKRTAVPSFAFFRACPTHPHTPACLRGKAGTSPHVLAAQSKWPFLFFRKEALATSSKKSYTFTRWHKGMPFVGIFSQCYCASSAKNPHQLIVDYLPINKAYPSGRTNGCRSGCTAKTSARFPLYTDFGRQL